MSASFIRLVLVFPPALETALTDALTTGASLPGFTLLHAEGHSGDFAHASPAEQVRGRIERRVVWVVIETTQLEPVLAQLRQHVPSREVRWWTESVLQQGRLG